MQMHKDVVPALGELVSFDLARARKKLRTQLLCWQQKALEIQHRILEKAPLTRNHNVPDTLLEYAVGYLRRCLNLIAATEYLLTKRNTVGAVLLARAILETTAMGCLFIHKMRRRADAELDITTLKSQFERFVMGDSSSEVKPIHIMDAIRHLEEIDFCHFKSLVEGTEKQEVKKYLPDYGDAVDLKSLYARYSISVMYSSLSSFAHPNGFITHFAVGAKIDVELELMTYCYLSIEKCERLLSEIEIADLLW